MNEEAFCKTCEALKLRFLEQYEKIFGITQARVSLRSQRIYAMVESINPQLLYPEEFEGFGVVFECTIKHLPSE